MGFLRKRFFRRLFFRRDFPLILFSLYMFLLCILISLIVGRYLESYASRTESATGEKHSYYG